MWRDAARGCDALISFVKCDSIWGVLNFQLSIEAPAINLWRLDFLSLDMLQDFEVGGLKGPKKAA